MPSPFCVAHLGIDPFERFRHGRQQILDGLLPCVDVGHRLRSRLPQARFSQLQERRVVLVQCLGAERAERLAKGLLGLRPDPFLRRPGCPLRIERGLQARGGGPAGQPPDERTHGQRGQDQDESGGIHDASVSHARYWATTNGSHDSGSCISAARIAMPAARWRLWP